MFQSIDSLSPGDSVYVQAHGDITEDFTGTLTRIDKDNHLVFVRHPDTEVIWGVNPMFIF